jgi:hypothetical protein
MRTKTIAALIHRLGLESWLTDAQMKEIVESQFKFLRNVIAEDSREKADYNNFRLINIGLFYVSEARRKWEQRHYKDKEYEEDSSARRSKKYTHKR